MEDYNNSNYNYNYDYNPDDDYQPSTPDKSIKGLKIMIVILAVILIGLSAMYFLQVKQMRDDFAVERDTRTNRLTTLLANYDSLRTENDTISQHLEVERFKTDSLLQKLQSERRLSYRKIREYEKQLGYMRTVMEGYIRQIDSLDKMNKQLIGENITYRKEIATARQRADMAEEKANELSTQVRKGSVIRARDIALRALSASDREVSRANRAARLRVDFVLVGNELSTPGERNVYVRIIGPDGYVMANGANDVFNYEGDMITYSAKRSVDYQNQDLSVSVFYNGAGITGGKYSVMIYIDGHLIGNNEIILR